MYLAQSFLYYSSWTRSVVSNKLSKEAQDDEDESDDDKYIFANYLEDAHRPTTAISIGSNLVVVIIDSGAQNNFIDEQSFEEMKFKPKLEQSTLKL